MSNCQHVCQLAKEKSESLCASVVSRNVSNLMEYAFIFGMVALWR
jgi:hypothetical protein